MCVVSMVSDYYKDKWPTPMIPMTPWDPKINPVEITPLPYKPSIFDDVKIITTEEWNEYQALKRKAVEYDIATQQPDCAKPDIEEWENDIEAFLILMGWYTKDGDVSTD